MAEEMVKALRNGEFVEIPESEARYEFPESNSFFGNAINMIPLQNAVSVARAFYGEKFQNQSLPLKNPEVPLVQNLRTKKPDGTRESFDDYLGKYMGAKFSDGDGEVTEVTPDYIEYKNSIGSKHKIDLYNNFPFNRKTRITNFPQVNVGDKIKKGQLVASSNYTDKNGTTAFGVNARIGLVPYKGWSMDDAVVVSESFAKRMASDHMYTFSQPEEKGLQISRDKFVSNFGDKYTKDQLANIDENGVVKEGTILKKDDPILLATKPRIVSSTDSQLGTLSKYIKNTKQDASLKWDGDNDGVVTSVAKGKNGWVVNVQTFENLQPGDKLAERSGNKCYHPDTEVFTENRGWVKIPDLTMEDKVAALFDKNDGLYVETTKGLIRAPQDFVAKFVHPMHVMNYEYDGELYCMEAARAAYCVTPNHRVFCAPSSKGTKTLPVRWRCMDASEVHNVNKIFKTYASFDLSDRKDPEFIEIPYVPYDAAYSWESKFKGDAHPDKMKNINRFPLKEFVTFMALFLSEGNLNGYNIIITQKDRSFCDVIEKTLNALDFQWKKYNEQYIVYSQKSLCVYLSQFGKAQDKFLPDWIKMLSYDMLSLFIGTYVQCDGNKSKSSEIYTVSERLKEDLCYVLTILGCYTTVYRRDRTDMEWTYKSKKDGRTLTVRPNYPEYTINIIKEANVHTVCLKKCPRKFFSKMQYKGRVYCCQVPGLGVIFTRLHGKCMWNGNSTLSKIIPDSEMPYTEDGQPLDVLLNPLGIPSRMNASLVMEMMLGKIAKKTGKPFKISEFRDDSNWLDFVEKKLKENNLTDTEKVYDPKLQRFLDNPITVGNAYVLKIHHTGRAGLSARNQGAYDSGWQQPLKGGDEGAHAKRLSGLEATSMLSAGAYNVLNDAMTLRGQKNDEYWRAVRNGQNPEMPRKSPFSWDKYLAVLSGSGLYAKEMTNGNLRLGPYTDKILEQQKPQEITLPEIVDNEMNPVQGGLFDPMLSVGNKWGKITLDEPYPNPAFESAITSLLGITNKEFNSVLQGKENLKNYGSGPQAIHKALKSLDTKQLELNARETIKNGTKTKKPGAIKLLNVLEGIKRNELKPEDFMISAVPVLPPRFRPYAMVGDTFIPGDANELYKELIHVRDNVRDSKKVFDDKDLGDEKSALYNAIKATYGFGEPVGKKLRDRKVSGFMSSLIGDTSKFSSWQRNVVSKPQDFTGSAVIDVDPDLGFDEMSMPNEMAWHLFAPYISQYMTRAGMSLEQATKEIEDRTPRAEQYLDKVMQDKVVFATRSPSWHKYNSLGFHAKRHEGKNILLNGLAETGMNGDHDGDKIMVHVPALAKAQQEVRDKLMPSKQLLSIRDKQTVVNPIKHEMVLGLYNASKGKGVDVYVDSVAEALRKIKSGEIKPEDNVHLRNVKTSAVKTTATPVVYNRDTYFSKPEIFPLAVNRIGRHEGFEPEVYKDTTNRNTLGRGLNIDDPYIRKVVIKYNNGNLETIDRATSSKIEREIIDNFIKEIPKNFTNISNLNDNAREVILNMNYNLGSTKMRKFHKLQKALNAEKPDYAAARREVLDSLWASQVGNRARELGEMMYPEGGKVRDEEIYPSDPDGRSPGARAKARAKKGIPIVSKPVTPSPITTPQYTPKQVMKMYPNANKVPQDMRQYYNVQAGDTVSGIAKKNRIPFSRIKAMNPNIKNFDKIRVGQPIRIAQNTPVAQPQWQQPMQPTV